MRTAAFLIGCCVALSSIASVHAQNEIEIAPDTGDPKLYGQFPIAYKEIVQRWLATKLADPNSAVIDWADAPKPGEYKTQKGERHVGYVVDFKVNARNQFGTYTGKQRYRVVIKNGEVLWGGHPRY
ncbi:MAG TPA: hypothetical protein VF511_11385 [Chthoniobacterales bacterium]